MPILAFSTTLSSFLNPLSISPNRTPSRPFSINPHRPIRTRRTNSLSISFSCNVALKPDPQTTPSDESDQAKIGARVRVTVPLKVYHVLKVNEIDLCNKEGILKQYVGFWKGKRISANLPFKIELVTEIEGRGSVKFVAHLKEGEFDYIE